MPFTVVPLGAMAAAAVGREIYRRAHRRSTEEEAGDTMVHLQEKTVAPALHLPDLDLPKETAEGMLADGAILLLTEGVLEQLVRWIPVRHREERWTLLYATPTDGYSLRRLYAACAERGPLLMLIRDTEGALFGAHIASELQRPATSDKLGEAPVFHGTGESFLFEAMRLKLPPLLDGSDPPTVCVSAYRWSHSDDLFVAADQRFLAVGGGGAAYGLHLDEDLQVGRTSACATFRSPPLGCRPLFVGVDDDAAKAAPGSPDDHQVRCFRVASLEVWSVNQWVLEHAYSHGHAHAQ